jgi:hypothetical protein
MVGRKRNGLNLFGSTGTMKKNLPPKADQKPPACARTDCAWRPYCRFPAMPCRGEGPLKQPLLPAPNREKEIRPANGGGLLLEESLVLEIAPFSSKAELSSVFTATLTFCSTEGVGFISSRMLKRDTAVVIRVRTGEKCKYGSWKKEGLKSAAVARVQESRPVESDSGLVYEIKAQYFT